MVFRLQMSLFSCLTNAYQVIFEISIKSYSFPSVMSNMLPTLGLIQKKHLLSQTLRDRPISGIYLVPRFQRIPCLTFTFVFQTASENQKSEDNVECAPSDQSSTTFESNMNQSENSDLKEQQGVGKTESESQEGHLGASDSISKSKPTQQKV